MKANICNEVHIEKTDPAIKNIKIIKYITMQVPWFSEPTRSAIFDLIVG